MAPSKPVAGRALDTSPYWSDTASLPTFARLDDDGHADVVVIGAGITGLTAAYLLASAGKSVIVLERERCAQVDTGHTSAHLTMVTDQRITDLVEQHGRDHARAVWDAGLASIAQVDAIVRRHDIHCDFAWVDGFLHAPLDGKAPDGGALRQEAGLAETLGFDASFVEDVPLVGGPGIRFDAQARFHPRKYLAGVARAFTEMGGRICEHSAVERFSKDPVRVTANDCTIDCDHIVVATHNPLVGLATTAGATVFQTKLALYTSYVVAGRVPPGSVPDALFWDTSTPYHYLRVEPHRDHDVVIFGGEDHKTGQETDTHACFGRLERTLHRVVPACEVTHRWSGQVIETPDLLPFVGWFADRQFAATGFAGNGLTFGTLGGMMAADAILAKRNPWSDLFDPGRGAVRKGLWDYVKENADYPYYLIRSRFAGAEGRSLRSVRRGQGKVIERNGSKVAAYRDESGETTVRSAICTHMGCVVAWNSAERTWDCPCHGSRFKPGGEVISGPAETPLAPVEP